MIGWGLAFTEIGGKYYGVSTSCWISLNLEKENPEKFKQQYDTIIAGIMKHYNAGTLKPLTLKEVERMPSDSTLILKDGKISYTDRKKKIGRICLGFKPFPLMYTDQGSPTMDLDELEDAGKFSDIRERVIKRNEKVFNEFCRTLRTQRLWVHAGWSMGGRDIEIIFDGTRTDLKKIWTELKHKLNNESKRLGLFKIYNVDNDYDVHCLQGKED